MVGLDERVEGRRVHELIGMVCRSIHVVGCRERVGSVPQGCTVVRWRAQRRRRLRGLAVIRLDEVRVSLVIRLEILWMYVRRARMDWHWCRHGVVGDRVQVVRRVWTIRLGSNIELRI